MALEEWEEEQINGFLVPESDYISSPGDWDDDEDEDGPVQCLCFIGPNRCSLHPGRLFQ